MMKGKVKAYSPAVNAGVVQGDDHKNYLFSRKEWSDSKEPNMNERITFALEKGKATKLKKECVG